MEKSKLILFALLIVISSVGVLLIFFATPWGIGASPDSVVYIGAANSMISGHGFSLADASGVYTPVTHHAPFYSALLSLFWVMKIEPGQAAKLMNAFLFSANIVTFGFLTATYPIIRASMSWIIPATGAILLLISPVILETHLMAWTEPLFLFLLFLSFGWLTAYIRKPVWINLVLSAAVAGMAVLTRYAGITLVLTGLVGIVFFSPGRLQDKLKAVGIFGAVSLTPVFFWITRNLLIGGTTANRELSFHPITKTQLWIGINTVSGWFGIPESAPSLLKFSVLMAVALTFIAILYFQTKWGKIDHNLGTGDKNANLPVLGKLVLLFITIYVFFLIFSISFFDANTPLDDRMLSPIYISGLLLAVYAISILFSLPHNIKLAKYVFSIFLLVFSTVSAYTSIHIVSGIYINGIGLNSRAWHESETLKEVEKYPLDISVFTNAPDAVYLHLGRSAASLPRKFESAAQKVNNDYESDMAFMKSEVDSERAVIVYFSNLKRPSITTDEELNQEFRLNKLTYLSDGMIFSSVHNVGKDK
jgi:hypothetical protein